ncbi:hypothetical protein WMY93_006606 [Mugilogobius chulae]|uniref:DDB1- and CUL4-associated factor 15 WD40 repeat-containing domain-containing protein n=1 Tax=Mugilogobius chulae TaxID=88201 RepID=A0AAW0PP56_9GOBI
MVKQSSWKTQRPPCEAANPRKAVWTLSPAPLQETSTSSLCPLKNIVNEEFLRAGHIFLGFTKWVDIRLKQVHHVRLFAGEEIYSDLYLTVCEWPNDTSKIVIFGFNTRSSSSVLMNLMMSDENNRDIYITIAQCRLLNRALNAALRSDCLEHGYVLNSRYQVVYPFPTFQPAFQLKKDQVVLLNTSYSLVACGVSLCSGNQDPSPQILYTKRLSSSAACPAQISLSSVPQSSPERRPPPTSPCPPSTPHSQSQAAARAREFAADLFRRAQASGVVGDKEGEKRVGSEEKSQNTKEKGHLETQKQERLTSLSQASTSAHSLAPGTPPDLSSPTSPPTPAPTEATSAEPGYVNYSYLQYRLPHPGASEQGAGQTGGGYEDDKVQLPFTVTDLKGRNLELVNGKYNGQCVSVEQLTLDFEYLINEVIRNDASWASQFCSFSDYDVVILEVCPETNIVMINIGLLLLAFSNSEEEHCRPNTYHSNLRVSWDLNTGVCCTVGVGDLTEVKGQTSGSVWSSYRKTCVNTVMKWLVPESGSRYINRMTNEALHKGSSLQVLADSDRCTWIVL